MFNELQPDTERGRLFHALYRSSRIVVSSQELDRDLSWRAHHDVERKKVASMTGVIIGLVT